jgi:DNA-directed RNA polymerase specialized sigma24 family protein
MTDVVPEAVAEVVPPLPVLPTDQVTEVRSRLLSKLASRGLNHEDSQDAVHNLVLKMLEKPGTYADRLAQLDDNEGWFMVAALNEYYTLLRSERRRRSREDDVCLWASRDGELVGARPGVEAVLAMADEAGVTPLQRAYLVAVLVDNMVPKDIASVVGTSPRAVRAVLQRAVLCLRHFLLRQAG